LACGSGIKLAVFPQMVIWDFRAENNGRTPEIQVRKINDIHA